MKWEKDLIKDIRTNSAWDDKDGDCRIMSGDDNPYYKLGGWKETSELSRDALKERFLRVRDTCSAILEIGISRNGPDSFTQVFLKNKKKETVYIPCFHFKNNVCGSCHNPFKQKIKVNISKN